MKNRTLNISTSMTSRIITKLDADTQYVFNIRAYTNVGAGPETSLSVTTFEDGKYLMITI